MAENQEVEMKPELEKVAGKEEGKKIPVFTVLKNNTILKNIFLIDTPPSGPSSSSSSSNLVENKSPVTDKQEVEEILVVGRHPDCNITLEHPSISRFHLRIHSVPSKQSLSVCDLSSVHGTWVCGKRIAPGVQIELHDGDILQLGGSSRIYRLHWIPLSHAYDYDYPFLPTIEESETVEEKGVTHHDDEGLSLQHDDQSQMETDDLLFTDMDIISQMKQLIPLEPSMPEDVKSPFSFEEEAENKPSPLHHSKSANLQSAWQHDEEGLSSLQNDQTQIESGDLDGLGLLFTDMTMISERTAFTKPAPSVHEDVVSPFSCKEEVENKNSCYLSETAILQPVQLFDGENSIPNAALAAGESQHINPESSTLRPQLSSRMSIWNRRGKSASVSVQTSRAGESSNKICIDFEVKPEGRENLSIESVPGDPFASEDSANEVFSPNKENCTPDTLLDRPFKKFGQEKRGHELDPNSLMPCMCGDGEEAFTPDKENITPNTLLLRSLKKLEKMEEVRCPKTYRSSPLKNADSGVQQEVDKLGSSKKVNHVKKLLQENKPARFASGSRASSEAGVTLLKGKADRLPFETLLASPNDTNPESSSSEAGVTVSKGEADRLPFQFLLASPNDTNPESSSSEAGVTSSKGEADRLPFQSLLASPNDTNPESSKLKAAIRSWNSINEQQIKEAIHPFHNTPKEENKKWTMVADAASLLNKESRKALQHMQGLQGTSLIIPRIVIRELDCLKRHGNLFRRTTQVSSALEWIEDCMVNAETWIHVQSSKEDVRPFAPTPPASPLSLFSQEIEKTEEFSISSVPFSPCGSWLDIVSPTTEDHILECALFFRRIRNNGQLVLLSNDVTLKIKAMAEGLLCETAEEFRQSLVSPFSERFLWTDSSPRGPTWSCVDDVVLREKYYNGPIRKQPKSGEVAKGLKLILLHNSHFKQISSVR